MTEARSELSAGNRTEERISVLTPILGFGAGAVIALLSDPRWGGGVAVGAALAWLNFRYLKQGLDGLVLASAAQEGREKPTVPFETYFRMAFRYGLIAAAVYAIFELLSVPLLSMLVGLCALGAATMAASLYEIFRPSEKMNE